ncbi:unnamed protein product [Arctia plantaginis]|uniref:Peptidase S1 domain-containing protein n=1 Tax=Arctia plantaginis TaxID=874455 RepID=A0A8S0YR01_ARCPL|nr:unnamed protein product [Arctia plantaginis]
MMFLNRGVWSTILNYNKISGSSDARIENFPFNAFLHLYGGRQTSYCGGSIVSTKSVVTSARCLYGVKRVKVSIGSTYRNKEASLFGGGYEYLTTSFSTHPRYNYNTGDFDVGVVNVDGGMQLDGEKSRIIRLPGSTSDATEGEVLTITGWGSLENTRSTERNISLQMSKVSVITRKECRMKTHGISTRMFCATGESNICTMDYGSPAIGQQFVLTGITSYSANYSDTSMPGVYTRVGQSMIRRYLRMQTGV